MPVSKKHYVNDIEQRIKVMLAAEGTAPEKDSAGIYNARAVDAKIRRDILLKFLEALEKESNEQTL